MDSKAPCANHRAMDTLQWLMTAVVFTIAGCVKGVTGMGLPTVAMSLLGLWMAPVQAAALLVVPSLATNVVQCRGPHWRTLARRLWPGWVAIFAVTVASPGFSGTTSADSARQWLGWILVAYGAWGLWRPTLPDLSAQNRWLSAVAGAATGVITAATAVFVLPWVPYLQALRLDKDQMVQALGLSFTVATVALAVRVQASALPSWWTTGGAMAAGLALAGAFAGMKAGEALRSRLAGAAFQKVLFGVFIALGLANLARAG